MLESLNKEGIEKLAGFIGIPIKSILISGQRSGTLIRVVTSMDKWYVLEIVDPKLKTAHLARCKPSLRGKAYFGIHTVNPSLFEKGDTIKCSNETTFEMLAGIVRIERLDKVI